MYIKISNLVPVNGGGCDYKGLDINQFASGLQFYPSNQNHCYVITNQTNVPAHDDIQIVTEAEYLGVKESEPAPVNPLDEIKTQLAALQVAMDDLILNGGGF